MIALAHEPLILRILRRMEWDGILLSPEDILDIVDDPNWHHSGAAHDWRSHVPTAMREQWKALPLLARLCVFETAELTALEADTAAAMVTGPPEG